MEAHPKFKLPNRPPNNSIVQAYKRFAQVIEMAVRTERGQYANMKAFARSDGARPTEAANLGVLLVGSISAFMAQQQPAVIPARYKLMDNISSLSSDNDMDLHEVYGLMGRASETFDPPTSSVTSAANPSSVTLFNK